MDSVLNRSVVKAPPQKTPAKAATPFFSPVIQPKLTINQPNDPYELEADTVADKVMRMTDHEVTPTKTAPVSIQQKCAHCEEEEKLQLKEEDGEEEMVHRKCASCEDEGIVQKSSYAVQRKCAACEQEVQRKCTACNEEVQLKASGIVTPPVATPAVYQTIQSSGSPMDANTRSFMESRFNQDFSEVQIHNDMLAHQSAKEINARAYTHGQHVVFGAGEYQPDTDKGKHLLAHELVHTMQQGSVGRMVQRDDKCEDLRITDRYIPSSHSLAMMKNIIGQVTQKHIHYYFIIDNDLIYIYDSKEYITKVRFKRASSKDLEGYFINYESDLSLHQNDDSWHFVRQSGGAFGQARLVPMWPAYQSTCKDDRHTLSLDFFHLLHDFVRELNMVSLSMLRHENALNIAVAVLKNSPPGPGDGDATPAAPRYIFKLPPWLSEVNKNLKKRIAQEKEAKPDDQSLPSDFQFYGSTKEQEKHGDNVWMLKVENGKQKKYITINKNDYDKANDKEAYANSVYDRMVAIVADQNRTKASKEFDKKVEEENKVKAAKGSKWAPLFKLRDQIWLRLEIIKKAMPASTDIPEKLTLIFYGETGSEQAFFKIWLQKPTTTGSIEYTGSAINVPVTADSNIEHWVLLIKQQTAIQRLVMSGTDPKEFMNWENRPFDPKSQLQLAPFPAELIGKNLNPDFSTVKGAENEFLMSLNWYAVYGMKDDITIASILNSVKSYYDFRTIPLPQELQKKKEEKATPEDLKKASTEYIQKDKTLTPFGDSGSVQRKSSIEISMGKEGSFLLVSYANIKDPDDKAPRAISAAAHPYFVTDINVMADKTALAMDVVAGLRKKLSAEQDPEKRKLLEDQIREIEERQSKGYAVQAREDIGDIDKLISQANALLAYIKVEENVGFYNGDYQYDPFYIRIAKKKQELLPIYNLVKGKNFTFSFDDDIMLTNQFIHQLEKEKKELGKLIKRVSDSKGKFKANTTRYKALGVSVNEDNGRIVPLMLLIGEHTDSEPSKNKHKHIIYDVTNDSYSASKMLYTGDEKSSEEQSVNSAFVEFGKKNEYGDGKVAYRVPALGYTGTVSSYTTTWEWIEKALMVIAMVLLAFGVILSGGALGPLAAVVLSGITTALGVSAGIMGVVLAIRNMASRHDTGTLEMNAETGMDILNMIGGFTGGVGMVAKYAKVAVSTKFLVAYEIAEFSGNLYLVHAKLEEDLIAIKNLNLKDPKAIEQLKKQAYAEAEQQKAMMVISGVASRLTPGPPGKINDTEIPVKAKETIEKSGYQSYRDRKWLNDRGEVTMDAPPFLRDMDKAAKQASQEPPVKTRPDAPTIDAPAKPVERPAVKPKEPANLDPDVAVAKQPVKIGDENHTVIVTKDGIGLCSPSCPNIGLTYKKELNDNPHLAEKWRKIKKLGEAGNDVEVAKQTAALIPELEAAKVQKIEVVAPVKPADSDTQAGKGKDGDTPDVGPGKPTQPPIKPPTPPDDDLPNSPVARKKANEWEAIAHDYEKEAIANRKLAQDQEKKAEDFRRQGREEEAKAAEQNAAAARKKAADALIDATFAKDEASKLRGGTEGLSGEQLDDQKKINANVARLREEVKSKQPGLQERQDAYEKAKSDLQGRKDKLAKLELDRKTPGTREEQLSWRDYQKELAAAKASVESGEKRVRATEKARDREWQPIRDAEKQIDIDNKKLHDLDKLDKGLASDSKKAKGDYAEAKGTEYMKEKDFEKIGGHHDKEQGIDGIYRKEKPETENIVAEIKYVDDAKKYLNDPERAKRELLKNTVKDGKQLSKEWTENRLEEALKNNTALADQIRQEGYKKILLIYDAKTRQFLTPIEVE